MKKLFALVLVVAMAFAIALPALAATGWDQLPSEDDAGEDFDVNVEKYEFYGSTGGGYPAEEFFANWDDKKGVVKDTVGRVYFELDIPTKAELEAAHKGIDFSNLSVVITITNVKEVGKATLTGTKVFTPAFATTNISGRTYKETIALGSELAFDSTFEAMYVFRAADAANVVATITVKAGSAEELPLTSTSTTADFKYGSYMIGVSKDAADPAAFTFERTGYAASMVFNINANEKITSLILADGTDTFEVFLDVNGQIAFADTTNGTVLRVADGASYNTLKGYYDFYMGALGFAWDGTAKYMNEELIIKNLFKAYEGKAYVTFPGGYVSITDPSVNPPQTGDATTVVGFVMIALALVAAAAVTVKKVRA